MIKKIFLFIILLVINIFVTNNIVVAKPTEAELTRTIISTKTVLDNNYNGYTTQQKQDSTKYQEIKAKYDAALAQREKIKNNTTSSSANNNTSSSTKTKEEKAAETAAKREEFCTTNPGECIESPSFTIDTSKIIGPNKKIPGAATTKELTNLTLGTIIQNLMIAMGSISLLIMTIGAGYIIFHTGQDDILSKGKSIFTGGLIALGLALSSYYMVNILRFVLYKGN